jgi:CDP-paratose 2-epimerase
MEDQGWVAWFIIAAVTGRPITIYGDGKQVRDVLFIDDLLDVYDAAVARIRVAAGQVYNIGGGPQNTLAVWAEFGPLLERLLGRPIPASYGDWRPGDQRVYISDIRKAARELGWVPRVGVEEGIRRLYQWVVQQYGHPGTGMVCGRAGGSALGGAMDSPAPAGGGPADGG